MGPRIVKAPCLFHIHEVTPMNNQQKMILSLIYIGLGTLIGDRKTDSLSKEEALDRFFSLLQQEWEGKP